MPYLVYHAPYEDTEHALAAKRCHEPAARLRCDSKCAVSHTSAMRWCAFAAATQSSQSSIAAAAILRVARYLQISSFSSSFSLAESSAADQLRSKHGRLSNFEDRHLAVFPGSCYKIYGPNVIARCMAAQSLPTTRESSPYCEGITACKRCNTCQGIPGCQPLKPVPARRPPWRSALLLSPSGVQLQRCREAAGGTLRPQSTRSPS